MIKRCCSAIIGFAKRRPSVFIVILLLIVFGALFGTYEALHITSSNKFCGMCHVMSEKGPGAEFNTWKESNHAMVSVGCIDCHSKPGLVGYMRAKMGGLYDLYGELFTSTEHKMEILTKGATDLQYAINLMPNERCLSCHSTEYNQSINKDKIMSFLGVRMNYADKVRNPEFLEKMGLPDIISNGVDYGADPKHATHIKDVGLSCMNCHMGIGHAGKVDNVLSVDMQGCFTCHEQEKEAKKFTKMPDNADCATCHENVVKIQKGDIYNKFGVDNQEWLMPSISCDSCHDDAFTKPSKQKCIDCHDESYGGMLADWQNEFTIAKAELDKSWNELRAKRTEMTDQALIDKFNSFQVIYKSVSKDSARSVHNTFYVMDAVAKAKGLAEEILKP